MLGMDASSEGRGKGQMDNYQMDKERPKTTRERNAHFHWARLHFAIATAGKVKMN